MNLPEDVQDLTGWDWYADLRAIERGIPWLARKMNLSQSTIYAYRYGQRPTPPRWLNAARQVIDKAS